LKKEVFFDIVQSVNNINDSKFTIIVSMEARIPRVNNCRRMSFLNGYWKGNLPKW